MKSAGQKQVNPEGATVAVRARAGVRRPGPRPGEPKGEMREALMRAALRLMSTKGYHGTKVSDIVALAGATQGTYYWYFDSKVSGALQLLAEGRQALLAVLIKGYREQPDSTQQMIARAESLYEELFTFGASSREFMLFYLLRGFGACPEIDEAISGVHEAVYEAFLRNIKRAQSLGMIPASINPSASAAILHEMVEGTLSWWLFGHAQSLDHKSRMSSQVISRELARFEFFGLLGREG